MPEAFDWSAEKQRLFRFERNTVVSAAAGSGKTTALVELYLRLLEGLPAEQDGPGGLVGSGAGGGPGSDGPGPGGLGPDGRPLEPEEIVVVTFTEKAAQDLTRKIREGLLDRLDRAQALADPAARRILSARWEELRARLEVAPIGTIHHYAARLLREHPVEAGVDPGFDVLDEADADTLRREATADVVREALDRRDPALVLLLGHLPLADQGESPGLESSLAAALARLRGAGTGVEQLRRATRARLAELDAERARLAADLEAAAGALRSVPAAQPFLAAWDALPGPVRRLAPDLDDAAWQRLLALVPLAKNWRGAGARDPMRSLLEEALGRLPPVYWQRAAIPLGEAFFDLLVRVDDTYAAHKRRRRALDFDDLEEGAVRLLLRDLDARGALLGSRPAVVLVDEFQDNNRRQLELVRLLAGDGTGRLRDRALVVVGDPKQSIYRFRGADVAVFRRITEMVAGQSRLAGDPSAAARSGPDGPDVLPGITDPVAGEAAAGSRVSGRAGRAGEIGPAGGAGPAGRAEVGGRTGVAGAIGAATGADPAGGAAGADPAGGDPAGEHHPGGGRDPAGEHHPGGGHDPAGGTGPLRFTENFRSVPGIIAFVNALFARYMGPSSPERPEYEVPFDPGEDALEPRRPWAGRAGSGAGAGGGEAPGEADRDEAAAAVEVLCLPPNEPAEIRRAREAEAVVRRIRQLVAGGIHPGQIAVLVRTLRHAPAIQRGLEAAGVPAYLIKGSGFYGAAEIRDVLCLLASLDSPLDDLALAAVLRSPFAGVSDDALLLLARPDPAARPRPLHRAFRDGRLAPPVPALPETDRARLAAFAAWHHELRGRKDRTPLPELIEEALERSGYITACLTRAGGDQQLANLRKLVEQARAFEARPGRTLRDFVRELARAVSEEPRETAAQVVGESEDVVRIMTIHAAKGLEFPVVVVPGCADEMPGDRGPVILDEDPDAGGLALRPVDPATLETAQTWLGKRLGDARRQKAKAEWRRLFYVATTRARDRLILVGEHPVRKDGSPSEVDTWRREVDALLADRPDLEAAGIVRRIRWEELGEPAEVAWPAAEAAGPTDEAARTTDETTAGATDETTAGAAGAAVLAAGAAGTAAATGAAEATDVVQAASGLAGQTSRATGGAAATPDGEAAAADEAAGGMERPRSAGEEATGAIDRTTGGADELTAATDDRAAAATAGATGAATATGAAAGVTGASGPAAAAAGGIAGGTLTAGASDRGTGGADGGAGGTATAQAREGPAPPDGPAMREPPAGPGPSAMPGSPAVSGPPAMPERPAMPAQPAAAPVRVPGSPGVPDAAVEAVVKRIRWCPARPSRFVHTVTELAEFAACPHRYYLTRRIGLSDADDPWFDGGDEPQSVAEGAPSPPDEEAGGGSPASARLSALDLGSLAHAVLEHVPLGLDGAALASCVRELIRQYAGGLPGSVPGAGSASASGGPSGAGGVRGSGGTSGFGDVPRPGRVSGSAGASAPDSVSGPGGLPGPGGVPEAGGEPEPGGVSGPGRLSGPGGVWGPGGLPGPRGLSGSGSMSESERDDLAARITAFLNGQTGRALARAWRADPGRVLREYPFALRLADNGATLIVHGKIDLLWRDDDGGLHLIDYKTARGQGEEAARKYEFQLLTYALAAGRLAGTPVRRAGIVFLLGEPAEPAWLDVGPEAVAGLETRAVALARRIAELQQQAADSEGWPRIALPDCRRLGCGFVARCYGSRGASASCAAGTLSKRG